MMNGIRLVLTDAIHTSLRGHLFLAMVRRLPPFFSVIAMKATR